MTTCPFCLESAQIEVLARNEHCYLAPTNDPVLTNSVMIIPFRHVETPFELNPDEWASTHTMLQIAKQRLDVLRPDGYCLGWNVHATAGQTVAHVHLHVMGRYRDEPGAGQGIRHALKQSWNSRPE